MLVAFAATGLLAACGNNDSTASNTPTLKTSTTTAAASPTPTSPKYTPVEPPAEAPTTLITPEERPQPAPQSPGPANTAPVSGKDQAFLDELHKRGVSPSSPDIALTAANYVCQGKASGASDQEIATYVNAMAGSDPAFDASKMSVEQAGKIYIDVATTTYCNK
ncbi:DUF732 domain-containing protein [Nocardia sp. CDC159]|uniref:DUF732 domain-containing protein n=1 Tax=Nocardia pulmonis TaxID=2951408 RepID=A0A9X2EET8_9NOCA|nr:MULTISPECIES: DUF732 domain-containing protein [Nocardia]MCM6776851.1 DUF732 domain-containing protein [Nocardia pulmonis]MCM6789275.1 DUF732 domain-containing protein [Nocardia sp. CDC159]